jgi:hypothetical protein
MTVPLLLSLLLSAAYQQPLASPPMELSFARVAVLAGEAAALPIYLIAEDNYREAFQITLEFSPAELTFQKVDRAYLAEKANWKLTATVRDHLARKDRRVVQIDVEPGDAKFFPSGNVAHAHFLVARDRPDGDILVDATLAAPASSNPLPSAEPGKITVYTTPVFACFFYMH